MSSYKVSFQGDPKTAYAAMQLAGGRIYPRWQTVLIRLGMLIFVAISVFGGAATYVGIRYYLGLDLIPEQPFWVPVVGSLTGVLCILLQIWPYWMLAKRSTQNPVARDMIMTIDAKGVRFETGLSHGFTVWEHVDAIVEGKSFLAYVVGAVVIPIPFAAFDSAVTRDAALADSRRWFEEGRTA